MIMCVHGASRPRVQWPPTTVWPTQHDAMCSAALQRTLTCTISFSMRRTGSTQGARRRRWTQRANALSSARIEVQRGLAVGLWRGWWAVGVERALRREWGPKTTPPASSGKSAEQSPGETLKTNPSEDHGPPLKTPWCMSQNLKPSQFCVSSSPPPPPPPRRSRVSSTPNTRAHSEVLSPIFLIGGPARGDREAQTPKNGGQDGR